MEFIEPTSTETHRLYGEGLRLTEWAGERVASDQLLRGETLPLLHVRRLLSEDGVGGVGR